MKDLTYLEDYREVEFERKYYGKNGDAHNGCFKLFYQGRAFIAIASNGGGWEHVSVHPKNLKRKTPPTWDEMCYIKRMFFEDEETVVEYHPAKSQYVNIAETTLHLWRPTFCELPIPPKEFV